MSQETPEPISSPLSPGGFQPIDHGSMEGVPIIPTILIPKSAAMILQRPAGDGMAVLLLLLLLLAGWLI